MYKGNLVSVDFEESTITIEVEGDFKFRAGEYVIFEKEEQEEIRRNILLDFAKDLYGGLDSEAEATIVDEYLNKLEG